MKKLMLLLAVVGLIFASCGTPKTTEPVDTVVAEKSCCTLTPEQETMFANWENWEALELEQKEAVVGEMKAFLDECKAKCEKKCEKKCEGKAEGETKEGCPEKAAKCAEKEAKCAEFKAKWEAFETLELDAKKEMLDCVLNCMKEKEGCCKEKKEGECTKNQEGCAAKE